MHNVKFTVHLPVEPAVTKYGTLYCFLGVNVIIINVKIRYMCGKLYKKLIPNNNPNEKVSKNWYSPDY